MPSYDRTNRPPAELRPRAATRFDAKHIAPDIGLGANDESSLNIVFDTIEDLGGGECLIPGRVIINGNIRWNRNTKVCGVDPQVSQIVSTGSQRDASVHGVPADAPNFLGDRHWIENLTFDKVTLRLGPDAADVPRGIKVVQCQFYNSTIGLYIEGENHGAFAGVGAIECGFRLCDYGIVLHDAGPNHVVRGCDISECTEAAIHVDGMQTDGISLFISDTYCDHARRFLKISGTVTDGGVYIDRCGVELCGTIPDGAGGEEAAADGFAIEMNGGQVWLSKFQMFNGPHTTASFKVDGGTLYDGGGRRYWDDNEYCLISAGTIQIDQEYIFAPGKHWGTGQAPFAHASSSGGKVVASRGGYIGSVADTITLNDTTNTHTRRLAETRDANEREITFDIFLDGAGTVPAATSNTLRIQLSDGSTSPFFDLVFPLFKGIASVRFKHKPGASIQAHATFGSDGSLADIAYAAAAPTKAEFDALVDRVNLLERTKWYGAASDPGVFSATRFLVFTSIDTGTAAPMLITNLRETLSGPAQLGI